jgi:hypothetical protein
MFLGSDRSNSPGPVDKQLIQLTGNCKDTSVVYQSECTITVSSVTSAEAAGYYLVILKNTEGEGNATLQVQYKGEI